MTQMPENKPLNSTITGVTFNNNIATYAGAGVLMEGFWIPSVTDSAFSHNSVSGLFTGNSGGGMFVSNLQDVNLTVTNVSFTGNSAFTGAGLDVFEANVSLSGCSFTGNKAGSDGAGFR